MHTTDTPTRPQPHTQPHSHTHSHSHTATHTATHAPDSVDGLLLALAQSKGPGLRTRFHGKPLAAHCEAHVLHDLVLRDGAASAVVHVLLQLRLVEQAALVHRLAQVTQVWVGAGLRAGAARAVAALPLAAHTQ